MARVNKLYEKPLISTIELTDKVTVGKLVNGEYKVKTMLYSEFLAQIVDDTLVLVVTRAELQALIASSGLAIGVRYIITNAVGSTLSLLTQAVSTTVLDEIAVNASNGDNVSYDITTDIATAIQQTQINGNGFVKASGTTLSYDNSTYLTTIEGIAAGGELEGNYASPTLKNSSVVGKVLTGLSVSGSAVLSTDSILTGIGKLQNQVNGLAGGVEYQGTWNASTNTPTLTSSVGTQGFYYVVSVAGSTNLNGITSWELGDWAIFNGTTWQKVDNTDAVVSVNGYTGIVTLSAADVSAVPTSAISGTSGTIPLFGASNTLGNSLITQSGSNVTITGNGVVTGNLTVDTNTFFVDATANRVAVGTITPQTKFDVVGGIINSANSTSGFGLGITAALPNGVGVWYHSDGATTGYSVIGSNFGGFRIGVEGNANSLSFVKTTGAATFSSTLAVTGAVTGSSTAQFTKLGLGASPSSTANILISSNITGAVTAYGVLQQGTIQSGVTTTGYGFQNIFNTQAASFNLTDYIHYSAISGTIGAGSTVTNQYGYLVESNLTGATNNYGFYGKIPSATGRWNLYMTGTAANYLNGNLQVGSTTATAGAEKLQVTGTASISGAATFSSTLAITGAVTGSSTAQFTKIGIGNAPSATSFIFSNVNPTGATSVNAWRGIFSASNDVTSRLNGVSIAVGTQASTTISDIVAYNAEGTSFGAGSSATRVTGFSADSTLANALATNVYGFQGSIASGTNRWNLYMSGTAVNYLNGNLQLGSTTATAGAEKLQVTGTASISGALSIGNTVATAVAVASTHKVTVVIGGVTYYLLATNV